MQWRQPGIGQGQVLYSYATDVICTKGNNSVRMHRLAAHTHSILGFSV
jgi:hypothetical protein